MKSGLEDVVAAETVLSDVDGKNGRLIVRGVSLDELVTSSRYEDVVELLFDGFLPTPSDLRAALGAARVSVFRHLAGAAGLKHLSPVEGLRALMAQLADGDDLPTALELVAAPAVFTAGLLRLRAGQAPVPPDPDLSQAADAQRKLQGAAPSAEQIARLDR